MRAAVFNGPGQPITIEQVPDPRAQPDDILLRVGRCGICGSDLSMTSGGPMSFAPGRRFGHEYAGEVLEVGRNVTGIKVGDRVACLPGAACGQCDGCSDGNPLFCTSVQILSLGFAEYATVPQRAAVVLPQSLSLADGALVEPIACGLHAFRLAGLKGGERILVLGGGSMAVAVIYWARRLGAGKIVVLSRSAHRRDVLLAMGADAVLTFEETDDKLLAQTLGGPPDIVAECVGKPGMLSKAIGYVRLRGTVLSLGMCWYDEPIVTAQGTRKEVRVLFPHGYTVSEFAETAKAFDSNAIKPECIVSDVIALEDISATMDALRAGKRSLKVHVDPNLGPSHDRV